MNKVYTVFISLTKGFVLSHIIYNDSLIRQFGDIDIIVTSSDYLDLSILMKN